MQSRDVVATRLRPRLATVAAGAIGVWFGSAGDPAAGVGVGLLFALLGLPHLVWLAPETFREALRIGLERRYVDKGFAFGWLAPGFAWCGVASVLVGGVRLLVG